MNLRGTKQKARKLFIEMNAKKAQTIIGRMTHRDDGHLLLGRVMRDAVNRLRARHK